MTSRKTAFIPGEYYHVYNRGNSKQTIFHDEQDYRRFIRLLFLANGTSNFKIHFVKDLTYDFKRGEPLVHIGAYCLMPNHFHLLLTSANEGTVSKFMQKVSTGYSMYYNNKYKRTGGLYEGRFKAEHADKDEYLKYLFSYIHLNPIKLIELKWKEEGIQDKVKVVNFLENYLYSSYSDYLGKNRKEKSILNASVFPDYFSERGSIQKEMFEWISYKKD